MGFNFEPRLSREETWQTRVTELGRYRVANNHCNVREDDRDWPGLGKWVSYVRRQYRLMRQGRRSCESKRLSDERVEQLRAMSFVFKLREEMASRRFREGIEMLRTFRDEHGHVDVPQFFPRNPTLGLCVQELRKEFGRVRDGMGRRDSPLTARMISELRSLGVFDGAGVGAGVGEAVGGRGGGVAGVAGVAAVGENMGTMTSSHPYPPQSPHPPPTPAMQQQHQHQQHQGVAAESSPPPPLPPPLPPAAFPPPANPRPQPSSSTTAFGPGSEEDAIRPTATLIEPSLPPRLGEVEGITGAGEVRTEMV